MSITYNVDKISHIIETKKAFNEITGKQLNRGSYCNLFPILEDKTTGEKFFNIWRTLDITDDVKENHLIYTLKILQGTEFPDSISSTAYENAHLQWVNLLMNSIENPFEEFQEPKEFKVLSPSLISSIISNLKYINNL